jgi:hypothetical protein
MPNVSGVAVVNGNVLTPTVTIPGQAWPSFSDPNYWPIIKVNRFHAPRRWPRRAHRNWRPNDQRQPLVGWRNKTYRYNSCNVQRALSSLSALVEYRNAWADNWASY